MPSLLTCWKLNLTIKKKKKINSAGLEDFFFWKKFGKLVLSFSSFFLISPPTLNYITCFFSVEWTEESFNGVVRNASGDDIFSFCRVHSWIQDFLFITNIGENPSHGGTKFIYRPWLYVSLFCGYATENEKKKWKIYSPFWICSIPCDAHLLH